MNRKYNSDQIEFVRSHIAGTSFKDLTDMFNQKFGMNLSVPAMVSLADRRGLHNGRDTKLNKGYEPTQFKKGHIPFNKGRKGVSYPGMKPTQFKKGHKPANWVPIGTERLSKDGYIEVKIADGKLNKNWKSKHVLIWESANGPVPKNHVVIFGDGNKGNFDPDNLILVSRQQLVRLNQKNLIQSDVNLTRTGIIIADIYNKIGERKKTRGGKS
ncbi:HNH endonuclease signature motif containing protein [Desulfosporosinus sp. FKA]|uniref:HNH endonuclease signature motif containing protein n=1 Tax=Desulfosporosinus sp. FKA TaxID=1969834 RepID=UPI000B4A3DEB|nr:HNH endonuclease signature motif containing protein [Desulfosporosinus sp. FKA]